MHWRCNKPHGNLIIAGLIPGNSRDQLDGSEELAFDRYGNLYVADSNNHRIQ